MLNSNISYGQVDGKTCTDINECDLNAGVCRGGGTCVNTDGSFTCVCPPGLTLDSSGKFNLTTIIVNMVIVKNSI